MRLLFITNFYPPASQGGFEQWCQEVAEGLKSRGHDLMVLTSTYKSYALSTPDPAWVCRDLFLEMELASLQNALLFFSRRKKRETENLARLKQLVESYMPDAILIWGMWNLSRSLPALTEKLMPGKVVYYMGDYWPTLPSQFENYWNAPARNKLTGLPKALLRPLAMRSLEREKKIPLYLEHILFPSVFMKNEFERKGIVPQSDRIIPGAIDTKPYLDYRGSRSQKDTISLLFIGRLTKDKGVHTVIQAMGYLLRECGLWNWKLMIVGDGEPDYIDHLHELVKRENIESFVTFQPAQPKEAIPALYHYADIFVFASIWPEPFGRVIVEAMASGLPVVGTAVGGAAEILSENENALLFTPDDPVSLSQQLTRLMESPSLREQLGRRGREMAMNKFDIRRMTTEIESCLQSLAN